MKCLKRAWMVALGLAVLAAGCSESYQGERLLWQAQQIAQSVFEAPDKATDQQVKKAIAAFEKVIDKAPGTISAVNAHMNIGGIHLALKEYAKAREAYALVLKNYHQYKRVSYEARFAIARIYEIEKNWEEAITAYEDISERHPWTEIGIQVPFYMPQLYAKLNQPAKAKRAYERAIRIYTKRIPDAPLPVMANHVRSYLSLAYQQLQQWDRAVQVLQDLVNQNEEATRPAALMSIATIYQHKLNDTDKAKATYLRLIREHPDHPFAQAAKTQLQGLGVVVEEPVQQPATPEANGEAGLESPSS